MDDTSHMPLSDIVFIFIQGFICVAGIGGVIGAIVLGSSAKLRKKYNRWFVTSCIMAGALILFLLMRGWIYYQNKKYYYGMYSAHYEQQSSSI